MNPGLTQNCNQVKTVFFSGSFLCLCPMSFNRFWPFLLLLVNCPLAVRILAAAPKVSLFHGHYSFLPSELTYSFSLTVSQASGFMTKEATSKSQVSKLEKNEKSRNVRHMLNPVEVSFWRGRLKILSSGSSIYIWFCVSMKAFLTKPLMQSSTR